MPPPQNEFVVFWLSLSPSERQIYLRWESLLAKNKNRGRELVNFLRERFDRTDCEDPFSFAYLCQILDDFKTQVTPCESGDLKFIKSVLNNESMPLVHRIECAQALGFIHAKLHDTQFSVESFKICAELCKSVAPEDFKLKIRNAVLGLENEAFLVPQPAGTRIRQVQAMVERNLKTGI